MGELSDTLFGPSAVHEDEPFKVVIESPLSGDFSNNLRYALWCCRWVRLQGHTVYASHTNVPWYLDDENPDERQLGMSLTKEITDDEWQHWFGMDLGGFQKSKGMSAAKQYFGGELKRYCQEFYLAEEAPELWELFQSGEWPPHTKGFALASASPREELTAPLLCSGSSRQKMTDALWHKMLFKRVSGSHGIITTHDFNTNTTLTLACLRDNKTIRCRVHVNNKQLCVFDSPTWQHLHQELQNV